MAAPKKRRTTSKWKPSPPEMVQQFSEIIHHVPGAQVKKMFGYPAAFVNGHMFAGLFEERVFLRLGEHDRASFSLQEGARPFEPIPGRVMREYVTVPEWLMASADELRAWVTKASAYASTLPPKLLRPKRAKKPGF